MSKAIQLTGGNKASGTACFIRLMDKFFDALNVHNFHHGVRLLKPFQMPYTSVDDFRFKVLIKYACMHACVYFLYNIYFIFKWIENTFLVYLKDWKLSVERRTGFSKTEKKRMLLSVETHTGLQMTCKSVSTVMLYI